MCASFFLPCAFHCVTYLIPNIYEPYTFHEEFIILMAVAPTTVHIRIDVLMNNINFITFIFKLKQKFYK